MRPSRRTSDDQLRRIVREEIRAALREMLPINAHLPTCKEAAKWFNDHRAASVDRRRVRTADVEYWVDLGLIPAVRFGEQGPLIAASDLEWNRAWMRHTRDENDRDWSALQTSEWLASQVRRRRPRTPRQ